MVLATQVKMFATSRLIRMRMIRILWIERRRDRSDERIKIKNPRPLRIESGRKRRNPLRVRERLENIARVGASRDEEHMSALFGAPRVRRFILVARLTARPHSDRRRART